MNLTPRVMEIKINKWDLIKPKNFCTAEEIINEMERQPTEWEKIFAQDSTNNVENLVSKIHKTVHMAQYLKKKQKDQGTQSKNRQKTQTGNSFSKKDRSPIGT